MPPGDIASKADDVRQDRIRHVEREVDQGKNRAVPDGPLGEVVCATRKPMKAGELIDGEGGYAVYGLSVPGEIARRDRLIPMGLAYGLMFDRDVDGKLMDAGHGRDGAAHAVSGHDEKRLDKIVDG